MQRLRTDREEIDFEVQAERERLGIGNSQAGAFDTAQLAALREPAREMERDRERLEAAKQESSKHKQLAEEARKDMSEALGKNKEWFDESDRRDVVAAIRSTEETASLLRRRLSQQKALENLEVELKAVSARRKRQLASLLLPWDVIRCDGRGLFVGWLSSIACSVWAVAGDFGTDAVGMRDYWRRADWVRGDAENGAGRHQPGGVG